MRSGIRSLWSTARRRPALPAAGLGLLAAAVAASLALALTGTFTSAPAASAAVQANPVRPAMMRAMSEGSTTIVTAGAGASRLARISGARAEQAAMTWLRGWPGSRVLGESLGYATTMLFGRHRLVWLVSVDPAGGLYSVHNPREKANYVVELIDAASGRWLLTLAGRASGLPALPAIP
jgi:hypothetical protein